MKGVNAKSRRNAVFVGATFFLFGLLVSYLKGFAWNHPVPILFLPLWTGGLVWITYRWSTKYYNYKKIYLPDQLLKESSEYASRRQEWNEFLFWKISKHIQWFAIANAAMSVFKMIEYYEGESNSSQGIFFGVFALLSVIIWGWLKLRISLNDE